MTASCGAYTEQTCSRSVLINSTTHPPSYTLDCLSVCLSVSLSVCLSVSVCVCVCVCFDCYKAALAQLWCRETARLLTLVGNVDVIWHNSHKTVHSSTQLSNLHTILIRVTLTKMTLRTDPRSRQRLINVLSVSAVIRPISITLSGRRQRNGMWP